MNPETPFQPQQPAAQPQPQLRPQPQSYSQGSLNQSFPVPGASGPFGAPMASAPLGMPVAQPQLQPVHRSTSSGHGSKTAVIIAIVCALLAVAGIAVASWAYVNYLDQKNNVDSKITAAVNEAEKAQADKLAADFAKAEKDPKRLFVGPEDYGRLSFTYPKTWSVYTARDASKGGAFESYLNPGSVPPIATSTQYALRVLIEDDDYDKVVSSYKSLVSSGKLTSSSVKADEQNGTRLDGEFSKDIVGSAVIFKIRDKTVTLRTDANTFKDDFNSLVQTITFNK